MYRSTFFKALVFVAGLVWVHIGCAVGLGGINVTSALGQPLRAEIAIVSADKIDKSSLVARLASAEAFKQAGLEYPSNLPKLKFEIEERSDGSYYVAVSTVQPVNEPFVAFLVELVWPSGKLLREYALLLDPVGYQPAQPETETVQPVEPMPDLPPAEPAVAVAEPALTPVPEPAASAPVDAGPVTQETEGTTAAPASQTAAASAPSEAAVPAEAAPAASQTPDQQSVSTEGLPAEDALGGEEAVAESDTDQILVKPGDTLSKIAARIKPADVSLERMLVALYRENAGVFDGRNMNRIRAGKILKVPQSDAVAMLSQADAVEEIRVQTADWNAYRRQLAAARVAAEGHADKQEAVGKISAAVADQATTAKEPPKEVLKLSKGEAPNDKVAGAGKTSSQDKAMAAEEEAVAQGKALKEAKKRTALLEKNIKDMQRLAQLKEEQSAAAAVVASAPQAASSVAEAKPQEINASSPKVPEQPSLLDQMLDNPMHLAGGAAILLLLGGLAFVAVRRRRQGDTSREASEQEVGAATARIATPVAPSPETGDFTALASATPAAAETEEGDPIGEADLFLTFGRDAQAEEVLKEALKKNPGNIPVKLKLLSIYATRKDANSFLVYARQIKESGDVAAWEQAAEMGRQLEPGNPLYGGTGAIPETTGNRPVEAAAPVIDLDLGFGTAASTASQLGQTTVLMEPASVSHQKTVTLMGDELRTAMESVPKESTTMDFDVTGWNAGQSEGQAEATTVLNSDSPDDLLFDVTATHAEAPAASSESTVVLSGPAATSAQQDSTFTLDFPVTETSPAAQPPRPETMMGDLNFSGISLDFGNVAVPSASDSAGKGEHWYEVSTKLDLAKAYQEMGDAAGAREILEEVLRDGDAEQKDAAQKMLQKL